MEHHESHGQQLPDDQVSVHLIEALSRVWSKIRTRHPEVPPVVLLPAPSSHPQMRVLGHFAALRWRGRRDYSLHEVVVVAEHLDRPPEDIVETLLHEAAHALNFERGINDCTASQYHNRSFKKAARELGLDVAQVLHYGFAFTRLPPETAELYKEETEHLRDVLVHRHRPGSAPVGLGLPPIGTNDGTADSDKPGSRSRKAMCICPFIIRVSKKTFETTTIRCDTCGEPFRLA